MSRSTPFTVGVEEEYQIVDAETLALRPRASRILPDAARELGGEVQPELIESQIEIGTPVCSTLADVRSELVRLRTAVDDAARRADSRIVAVATHPFSDWLGQSITPNERYERLERDFQQIAREQLICGCHVHVCIPDRERCIEVMDRVRGWLPTLLALSANSPFWAGLDTGYSSYRAEVFSRFPATGIPTRMGSRAGYDAVVEDLEAVGAVDDGSFLYWDVRPSTKFETLEFRVADVALSVDEAVMIAGLCRSLARTESRAVDDGRPPADPRPEVLQAARWRASRYGLDGELVDAFSLRSRPAGECVTALLDRVRPDLEEHREWDEVRALVDWVLAAGNGATRQRAVAERTGSLRSVVDFAAEETRRGAEPATTRT